MLIFQDCFKLFNGWSKKTYAKLIEKNKLFEDMQLNIKVMQVSLRVKLEAYNKLEKHVSLGVDQWNFISRVQVKDTVNIL